MPEIVDRSSWLDARRALLAAEKELTRSRDAVAAQRRALPAVVVDEPYAFDTPEGERDLAGLFGGRSQLLVYHFMFAPDADGPCRSCAFWADGFDHVAAHLAARDAAFVAVSRAPLGRLEETRRRMGWSFPWVSSGRSRFNHDFGVTFEEGDGARYNYGTVAFGAGEAPGASAFLRLGDGRVAHTYSTFGRGLDALNPAYQWLDLAPRGRDEDALPWPMAWVRLRPDYRA